MASLMKQLTLFNKITSYLSHWLSRSPKNKADKIEMTNEQEHDLHNQNTSLVPYDENLLERARTQWQFGDWESLIKIERETLQHHPDRAKLALLAAAGHLQQGDNNTARQFTRLAQDWGCSKKLVSQILIAGVHNSLGRAAAVIGQQTRAMRHFESAIANGALGSDVRLISQARAGQQLSQLGLAAGSEGRLQTIKANFNKPLTNDTPDREPIAENPLFSTNAYAFYQGISQSSQQKESPQFILLDSKSLPRSGLHYMKNTFAKLLGDDFSFCEWYQEPGCCKKMPCVLTGYAQFCQKDGSSRLRLVKSHDLELVDPAFTPNASVRRVILVRDPLFILTSWFALEQLQNYKQELHESGINMEKIWIAHEPEIIESAFRILDNKYCPPNEKMLNTWLEEKSYYIESFMKKWVHPVLANPQPYWQVVHYNRINKFITNTLTELRDHLPEETKYRIDELINNVPESFNPRQNAFHTKSEKLSAYLVKNSSIFAETSNKILQNNKIFLTITNNS